MTKTIVAEILEISEGELKLLSKRIKPLVRRDGGLRYIQQVDLRKVSFLWDPQIRGKAKGLELVKEIETLHTYGAPVYFKPSIAEVIAQIPKEDLATIDAFETTHPFGVQGGHHVATTKLYRKK